ncbi:MAG TPA: beta-ketoacyl synthase N-terminal-like domain-containing protein [Syntrophorhabdaceae bacterium]|nr:beta-ketoacyl synthase N-terminal-like domain-containing protein [Syntrophorhabdaceae bacterium]
MKCSIQGIGVVGGFGCGLGALHGVLSGGRTEKRTVQVKTVEGSKNMPVFLADTSHLNDFVDRRVLRRVDHYSKMALLGSYLALEDAGIVGSDHSRMGVIVASGYGPGNTTLSFLDTFINDGDNLSSPTFFSNSVQNAAVANISIMLNITGPGLTVSQFELSVASALLTAGNWLDQGCVDFVLLGAVDEYFGQLGYFWHRFYGRDATDDHELRPFTLDLQTGILGEGAAFFLLNKAEEGKYGVIEEVLMGRDETGPAVSEDALLVLGADGHKKCGEFYRPFIGSTAAAVSYAPIYGTLPVGPAFDLAIAGLSIREKTIFLESSGHEGTYVQNPFGGTRINCLKINSSGEYGLIGISGQ